MTRLCGFEYEVHGNGGKVAEHLYQMGAIPGVGLHHYHCHCHDCNYENHQYLFAAQEDCTVSAEFVSKVLTFGSDRHKQAIKAITTAAVKANADLSHASGMHCHVDRSDMDNAADVRLCRLFARYSRTLAHLAAMARDSVRTYNGGRPNSDPDRYGINRYGERAYGVGSWLSNHENTWEFRLWNATKAPWRIHLATGMSVAMVEAAIDGVEVKPPGPRGRRLSTLLANYWDHDTEEFYWRQLEWKGHGKHKVSVDNGPDESGVS